MRDCWDNPVRRVVAFWLLCGFDRERRSGGELEFAGGSCFPRSVFVWQFAALAWLTIGCHPMWRCPRNTGDGRLHIDRLIKFRYRWGSKEQVAGDVNGF